jgi:hypothetical protein
LDGIFEALSTQNTLKYLKIASNSEIELNLKRPQSLRFLETNQSLTSINFSNLKFTQQEKKILNEALLKNETVTDLDFSRSNFDGPFNFLRGDHLKKFKFYSIWVFINPIQFFENIHFNNGLNELRLSFLPSNSTISIQIEKLIEFFQVHKSIQVIEMSSMFNLNPKFNFHNLLLNCNLRELNFKGSLHYKKVSDFFDSLNQNSTLKKLEFSSNHLDIKELKIFNKSIETLILEGKSILLNDLIRL